MKKLEGKAQREEETRKAFFHFHYYVAKIYFSVFAISLLQLGLASI
jgi:Mn2+/Fe2+ NRAMP family transporter